jgi:hypothetical protein
MRALIRVAYPALVLFLALGGVAFAGSMLIDGSSIKPRSLPADRLNLHSVTIRELRIPKERLVGAVGEPAFGSGWKNAGGGYQVAGFYRDQEGVVHLRGVVDLGSTLTIFTLPPGYRPAATEAFSALLGDTHIAWVFVVASGDVDLEFLGGSGSTLSLSQISFRAGL